MRVLTAAMPLAESADQLLGSCDTEALACLIAHKAITTAAEQGVRNARQMLFDWLALVVAAAAERGNVQLQVRLAGEKAVGAGGDRAVRHQYVGPPRSAATRQAGCPLVSWSSKLPDGSQHVWPSTRRSLPRPCRTALQADASLSDLQALHHLPHVVYSLLASPLLQEPPNGAEPPQRRLPGPWQHPDAAAAMRGLLRVLAPDELSVAVCPQLASWSSFDRVAGLQHSLSSAALAVGQQPLWVLDCYFQLIVLCTAAAAAAGAPFPPPADSPLRRTLAGIRSARRATPDLLMLRQGQDDTAPFDCWLLEDGPRAGAEAGQAGQAGQSWPSFVAFLDAVTREAQRLLAEGR